MPTIPAEAFHDRICDGLSDAVAPMLEPARGGGPEFREMQRALMLADRAVRDWAARAIGEQRPGTPNRFQQLGQLGRPEDHYHETRPAADAEVKAANSRERILLARVVQSLANAAEQLDTEGTRIMNTPALRATGEAAADVLLAAGAILDGDHFVVEQANRVLGDLVGLTGWQNQLGPRFE